METMSCAVHEGGQTREKSRTWDAGTARIVWYCVTLLFALAAMATLAPFALSPRGAEGIYWVVAGLVEKVPSDVAIMNAGQALVAGEGMWAAPMLLWVLVALYIIADAALVFSTWLGTDMGRWGERLALARPALRWTAAVAMMVLLLTGVAEQLLREGYTQRPDLWLQENGSAFSGLMLLLAGTLLIPVAVVMTVRLGNRLSKAVAHLEHRSALMRKVAHCCRAVSNGVVSWILLTTALVVGLVAYPVLLLAVVCATTFAIGVWITIKVLPFALGLTFLHLLCDRDI